MPIELRRYPNGQVCPPLYPSWQGMPTWERNGFRPLRKDCPHPRYLPEGARYCKQLHAFIPAHLVYRSHELHPERVEVKEKNVLKKIFRKKHIGEEVETWTVQGLTHASANLIPLAEAQTMNYIKYRGTGVFDEELEKNVELWCLTRTPISADYFEDIL